MRIKRVVPGERARTLPDYPKTAAQSPHLHVEMIDPRGFAEQAGAILRASWEPPCLCYPAEYLRWQFEFPGTPPALAAASFLGDEPIGLVAVMPRRLRDRRRPVEVHLLSFVSVLPPYRGMGTGTTNYRTLLSAIRDQGRPVVGFAESGSAAERMLIGTLRANGYRHHPLGHYRTHAYLTRPGAAAAGGVTVEETADLAEFLAVVERCDGPGTLWNAPGPEQLDHYRVDPRGRVLVLARARDGEAIGAAMVVLSEAITRRGSEWVAMVDNLFLPAPSAEVLREILDDAGRRWHDRVTSPVVTVPNLHGVNPGLARSIGLRATPSGFSGHLFAPADEQPFDARGTTLEIV